MKPQSFVLKIGILVGLAALSLGNAGGQTFTDAGFEGYDVGSGGFIKPVSGTWVFSNDAGVVRPFAPNSSTGPLNTWSANFSPLDGQQYASTYAGADTIRQVVSFASVGAYVVSAYAAVPNGTVAIPQVGTLALLDGEFAFTLGSSAIGRTHIIRAGSSWTRFSAEFMINTPGDYLVGIRNTASAPYFVNYDAFSIQAVPEPTTVSLLAGAGLVFVGNNILRNRKPRKGE